ncbi:MAG: putative molybdenum carrier protein [Desulfamplus sp.]|nr:putative molybdenum carrier protein [Desulfamplus sp.]
MRLKIISGGQTGADRAALDTAMKFNLEYGGWVPAGRLAEDGTVPLKYRLNEMPTSRYSDRTVQNVKDAHGTLIISHGPLSGGSLFTRRSAEKLNLPWCHLDILTMDEFEGALVLHEFVLDNGIEILNVAGPRASQDPFIYRAVKTVLEAFLYLYIMDHDGMAQQMDAFPALGDIFLTPLHGHGGFGYNDKAYPAQETTTFDAMCGEINDKAYPEHETHPLTPPAALQGAVEYLAGNLSLRARCLIANTREREIALLYFHLGDAIRDMLHLQDENSGLAKNIVSGMGEMDVEDAVMVILKALKVFLESDHVLRQVK